MTFSSNDVMDRLDAIRPLPRGERLYRYIDQAGGDGPYSGRLWERLFDRSRVLNALDDLFALDDVIPPRLVSLRTHAERWRSYAAPLRKAREERQGLNNVCKLNQSLLRMLRAENDALRANALDEK